MDITGSGKTLAPGDQLDFEVDCQFPTEESLETGDPNLYVWEPLPGFPAEVTHEVVEGETQWASQKLGGLPVMTGCTATETASGNADVPATEATGTISWDKTTSSVPDVVVNLANAYGAGKLEVEKILEGDKAAVEQAADKQFTLDITCQVGLPAEGETTEQETKPQLADIYRGTTSVRGGETTTVVNLVTGEDVLLPVGARCWADETDSGGADTYSVDHGTAQTTVVVERNLFEGMFNWSPTVKITATNTFLDSVLEPEEGVTPPAGGSLPQTGAHVWFPAALVMLTPGAGILPLRRSRRT